MTEPSGVEPPTTPLDLSDRMVRAMAERNHEPREHWDMAGRLMFVACDECGNTWPCPTRRALDALEAP